MQWKQEKSYGFSERFAYYQFGGGIPTCVMGGENPISGWGPNYLSWITTAYEQSIAQSSPAVITINNVCPNPESGLDASISIDLTENLTTTNNQVYVFATIFVDNTYNNVVLTYASSDLTISDSGTSEDFIINIPIEENWVYDEIKLTVALQSSATGRDPIENPILQAEISESAYQVHATTITGVVTDSFSNEALEGVELRFGSFSATTDENGEYTVDLMDGSYNLHAELDDYTNYLSNEDVSGNSQVDIQLERLQLAPNDLIGISEEGNLNFKWVKPNKIKGVREGFDSGEFASDWSVDDNSWSVTDNLVIGGENIALEDGYCCAITGANSGSFTLPTFDFSRLSEIELKFNAYYLTENGNTYQMKVKLSEDNGLTWTEIFQLASSTSWSNYEIDLSDYCGDGHDQISIAFEGNNLDGSNSGCALDDIICGRGFRSRSWDILGYNLYKVGNETPLNGDQLIENRNYSIPVPTSTQSYYVTAMYETGESVQSNVFEYNSTSNDENINIVGSKIVSYPNPFYLSKGRSEVSMKFNIKNQSQVNVSIYNVKGQRVNTISNMQMKSGNHEVKWNGKNEQNETVNSGIYFVQLTTNNGCLAQKLLIIK
jgi:hypothetical protein